MAWLLVVAADECLRGHERTMTFVELGSGEALLAVERILTAIASRRMRLPTVMFDWLALWLYGHAGSPQQPHLWSLVARVRDRTAPWNEIDVTSYGLVGEQPVIPVTR
ncbi:tryptophanase [Mycolicibacterium agri]|nr:tryptophanase [Mycolicibacterium agri]